MVYISPSLTIPKPLIVQASDRILASSDQPLGPWRRGELEGSVPWALLISGWAVSPRN